MSRRHHAPRPLVLAALLACGLLTASCAGSAPAPMPTTTPEPVAAPTTQMVDAGPKVRDLSEILGPVSFDPDTVEAGRFDTGKMWTFDFPPVDYFESAYGFRPDEEWLRRARMSALRFATWCTASFVSADGLVMTNHHCGRDPATEVGLPGEDLLDKGFYAQTLADERRVEGLFVDQLVELTDVTGRVHEAMDAASSDAEKAQAKDDILQQIQDEFDAANGMVNQVVELFNGGRYSVYTYKRYDDVRLVMIPELAIGYFGGDPDNFTYPRYNLDCSFFRVYEDGEPLDTSEFYYTFSATGPEVGEPVFVVGNPGSTTRLNTVSQLAFTRDYDDPAILTLYRSAMRAFRAFLDSHTDIPDWDEQNNTYFSLSNSDKAITGQLEGLQNAWLLARKADWEDDLRQAVLSDPTLKEKYGDPWTEIAEARQAMEPYGFLQYALSFGGSIRSQHLNRAFLVDQYRFMVERGMAPGSQQMEGVANQIKRTFSGYDDLELRLLTEQLKALQTWLGPQDPLVSGLLGMRQPAAAARYLLESTILDDQDAVQSLLDGMPGSMDTTSDPMIKAMKGTLERILPMQQTLGAAFQKEAAAQDRLARAVYDVYGTSIPPDATFTLRISDGVVQGYGYNGTQAPAWTTFYGLYDRWASAGGQDPWALPDRWQRPPAAFDMGTPLDFVSTNDIIGGNSGSAVITKDLEVVGAAFDGNIESLPGEFIFLPALGNRTVSVTTAGILEVIQDLYGFKRLADELKGGRLPR